MANYMVYANFSNIDNVTEYIRRSNKDMRTTVIVYRLSVYFSLCLTVSSLYLPMMKSHQSPRRTRNNMPLSSLNRDTSSSHRASGPDNASWNKRTSVYSVFSKMMTRHAGRHKSDKAFVDKMFNLFDLDRDRVIERREFKAVLQILGIVSHEF